MIKKYAILTLYILATLGCATKSDLKLTNTQVEALKAEFQELKNAYELQFSEFRSGFSPEMQEQLQVNIEEYQQASEQVDSILNDLRDSQTSIRSMLINARRTAADIEYLQSTYEQRVEKALFNLKNASSSLEEKFRGIVSQKLRPLENSLNSNSDNTQEIEYRIRELERDILSIERKIYDLSRAIPRAES